MRDKLIDILVKSGASFEYATPEDVADYLIAEGVIVPPCKVGDDIYWIDPETNEIIHEKADIKAICYYGGGKFKLVCGSETIPEEIGTELCMLTREESEKALHRSSN